MAGVEYLVAAGVPVIVGTGAQNTRRAAALGRPRQAIGAVGLMIIPRVLSRGASAAAQRAHFAGVLEAAVDLPSVIYNSPYYGFETRAELFFDLRRLYPHLVGFKEFGGADSLRYAAEHITGQSPDIDADGRRRHAGLPRLRQLRRDRRDHRHRQCAAAGSAASGRALRARRQGRRRGAPPRAASSSRRLAALSSFDEGADLVLYYKYLMTLRGDAEYALHFNESDALSASQKRYAKAQLALFETWYADWRGAED